MLSKLHKSVKDLLLLFSEDHGVYFLHFLNHEDWSLEDNLKILF